MTQRYKSDGVEPVVYFAKTIIFSRGAERRRRWRFVRADPFVVSSSNIRVRPSAISAVLLTLDSGRGTYNIVVRVSQRRVCKKSARKKRRNDRKFHLVIFNTFHWELVNYFLVRTSKKTEISDINRKFDYFVAMPYIIAIESCKF